MFSKLSLSLAAVLALSAVGVARANPTASSTDEARMLPSQANPPRPVDATGPASGPVSSTDEARALAGHSLPASSRGSAKPMIVTSTDEARAAVGAYNRALDGNESLAARPAVDTTPGRRN
jgi:hypothetical protein